MIHLRRSHAKIALTLVQPDVFLQRPIRLIILGAMHKRIYRLYCSEPLIVTAFGKVKDAIVKREQCRLDAIVRAVLLRQTAGLLISHYCKVHPVYGLPGAKTGLDSLPGRDPELQVFEPPHSCTISTLSAAMPITSRQNDLEPWRQMAWDILAAQTVKYFVHRVRLRHRETMSISLIAARRMKRCYWACYYAPDVNTVEVVKDESSSYELANRVTSNY